MGLTALFPELYDSSLMFCGGIHHKLRLGHVAMVDLQQPLQWLALAALVPRSA